MAACVKHFALNQQEEERLWVNVEIDERTLWEIYLPAFKAAESPLDIEMSVTPDFDDYCLANPLKDKLAGGEILEGTIDEKVCHIINLMVKLKMIKLSDEDGKIKVKANKDRSTLELPYGQSELIESLLAVRPDMVVVIMAGSPVAMGSWKDKARAVVYMSYSGMEGGRALAEVLYGKINPSGKLAESFPYSIEDTGITSGEQYPGRPLNSGEKLELKSGYTPEN